MTEDTLADRIARLEDREAIRTLCSRYSLSVDDHDFATLGDLFAPDALYGWVDSPPQATGREGIRELLRSRIGASGPSFHVNHDMLVDWEGPDAASGIVFCHAEVTPPSGQFIGAIRYRDTYVRHDGTWLFGSRFLSFLYFTPPGEYVGLLGQKDRLRHVSPALPAHWPAFA
jgi:ketosteroid isomerase-like protein